MEYKYNIYYVTIEQIHLSKRINVFTDSIEDECKAFAEKHGVPKNCVAFKIKHLNEKWEES